MESRSGVSQQALAGAITVRSIAELRLRTCAPTDNVGTVYRAMETSDIDLFPVGVDGVYTKYVERCVLAELPIRGTISDAACRDIGVSDVIPIHSTLGETLRLLVMRKWLFCIEGNGVRGVVTRGDLQRLPARTYFFAVVTAFEAQALGVIRSSFPHDEWATIPDFSTKLLAKANSEMKQRREAGEEPSTLAECLMFSGKLAVLKRTTVWKNRLSKLPAMTTLAKDSASAEDALETLLVLRNNVAHGYDLTRGLPGRWDDLLSGLEFMESATQELANS